MPEDDPDSVNPEETMRIGVKRKKWFVCWYCMRYCNLKHKDKSIEQVAIWRDEDVETNMNAIKVQRDTVVKLSSEGTERINISHLPDVSVAFKRKRADRTARRGRFVSLARFQDKFPKLDPTTQHSEYRKSRGGDMKQMWKIYDHDSSEVSFSEVDEDEVTHTPR